MDKIALDKHLTTEPPDRFTPWVEQLMDEYSDDFYAIHEDDIDNDRFNGYYNRLYDRGYTPAEAAQIIERIYRVCPEK